MNEVYLLKIKKISISFLISFFVIFIISCSKKVIQDNSNESSLRFAAEKIDGTIEWTFDIEENILGSEINLPEDIDRKVKISSSNIFLLNSDSEYPEIYPYLSNFGSLNISSYPESVLNIVKKFCNAIIEKESLDSYFEANHIYTNVIFKYELSKLLPDDYEFSSYLLCEPFIGEDFYECPVRFYYKSEKELTKESELINTLKKEISSLSDSFNKNIEGKTETSDSVISASEKNRILTEKKSELEDIQKKSKYNKNCVDVFIYLKAVENDYKINQISIK